VSPVQVRKLSPVLIVEAVEPCLPFWTERLGFAKVVVPRRQTFYGADEIGVREPGGNVVLLAQPA
jgi:hypothetical protein